MPAADAPQLACWQTWRAQAARIPVYLIDRKINANGIAAAQLVANNAGIRSKGFNDVIGQYPKLTPVVRQSANWDQQEAFTLGGR